MIAASTISQYSRDIPFFQDLYACFVGVWSETLQLCRYGTLGTFLENLGICVLVCDFVTQEMRF